jgi:outer membrane biosynthesis protein TonB
MTAIMRAVAATGPKVLRIGVVQGGRVTEERIIKQRTHVTVGPNEKSMFVIASTAIPPSFRLFELIESEYYLNFVEGMSGRVALPTGISDLSVLKGQAKRTPQGAFQVKVSDDSRGKIAIGETTFLFQFVAPPPMQPKPQLPVAVMRGATSIDWSTTMIAAFSFLLHFLGIGSLYSDWLDPIINEEANLASLVDSVKSLPPPPVVEQQATDQDKNAKSSDDKQEAKASGAQKSGGAAAGPGKMSSRQVAALTKALDSLEMATIGALSAQGPATAGVLAGGEVATGALDEAAKTGAGISSGMGDLKIGGGGGTVRPGAAGGGLGALGASGRTEGTQGTGAAQKVSGPKGNANVGGAAVSGGEVANASRVVAGMRAGFRNCFNRELAQNPDAQGRIDLSIKVGPGGEVQSVSAASSGNLGSAVECVKARARGAQFDPPAGGSAVVKVPVTFVKQ